jgi:hypothetical protein
VLGRTDANRWLFVAFTIRDNHIRVISARDMNQKESKKYGTKTHYDASFPERR